MNKQKQRHSILIVASFFFALFLNINTSQAQGGLSLGQTRVIFNAKENSTKVSINNLSNQVYLLNSRVLPTPDLNIEVSEKMPFLITPPLFRLEKESRNSMLISKNDTSKLPLDRESVFYLSFLAIPAVKKHDENEFDEGITSTQVSFGIRTIIKLFYRPTGLSMPVKEAPAKLTFDKQGAQLIVNNPTPYYVTLAQLTLNHHEIDVREQGPMIAPFSAQTYSIKEMDKASTIEWSVINDFGGMSEVYRWSGK